MKISKRKIDHLVYAVPNLEEAIEHFKNFAGVEPILGGKHLKQGTKNALVKLSTNCYLEFLAVDDDNKIINAGRWMGIDLISKPQFTRWSVKSNEIEKESKILESINPELARVHKGERKISNNQYLNWQLTQVLSSPAIEICPFLIDWQNSEQHPSDSLEDSCKLLELNLYHPFPELYKEIFEDLGIEIEITTSAKPKIQAKISCPNGIIAL